MIVLRRQYLPEANESSVKSLSLGVVPSLLGLESQLLQPLDEIFFDAVVESDA